MTHTIRPATPADQKWIQRLLRSHRDLAGSFYWSWQGWVANPQKHTWLVAEDGGLPVGTLHYYRSVRRKAYCVAEVMVEPFARRHGVGRQLLGAVPEPIVLTTNADNPESHQFYLALGFSRLGESKTKRGAPLVVYGKGTPCAE